MRSRLHAVIPTGENCEREPLLETDMHLYWNSYFPACNAHQLCTAQYVFLMECRQSVYLADKCLLFSEKAEWLRRKYRVQRHTTESSGWILLMKQMSPSKYNKQK